MKRTLPFGLATLGILALFAASPILPKLGVPLDVEKVLNAVFQDDAVEEVVLEDVYFSGPNATCFPSTTTAPTSTPYPGMVGSYPDGAPNGLVTEYTRGEIGQLLPDTACNGSTKITGRWYMVTGQTLIRSQTCVPFIGWIRIRQAVPWSMRPAQMGCDSQRTLCTPTCSSRRLRVQLTQFMCTRCALSRTPIRRLLPCRPPGRAE